MEVGEYMLALYVLRYEPELAVSYFITLQVSLSHLEHTTLQTITGQFWGRGEGRGGGGRRGKERKGEVKEAVITCYFVEHYSHEYGSQ